MTELNRRTLLSGAALAGAAITLGPIALNAPARASAPAAGKQVPGFYRYKIGDYEVTALNDGVLNFELKDGFVKNAPHSPTCKRRSSTPSNRPMSCEFRSPRSR